MANNVGSALSTLLTSGQTFYAPFADKGSGEVSLVASGAGASQSPTFTRATTATTVNSAGLIVSVASGTPRSYYDPTSLAYLGYMSEGARTNLYLQSAFASGYAGTRATGTPNAATAPDGATAAYSLVEDSTATSTHFALGANPTISNATVYTVSVFAKANGRDWIAIQGDGSSGFLGFPQYFNVGTGVVGALASGVTSRSITAYPNGWYRCTVTATSSGTSAFPAVFLATADGTNNYSGNGTSGAYFWGIQLEAGSFASTYIPTTTASVTRNADVLTYPSSGNALNTTGSVYAEVTPLALSSTNDSGIISLNDGTSNNRILMRIDGAASRLWMIVTNGGATQISTAPGAATFSAGSVSKVAHSYVAGTLRHIANGGTVNTSAPAAMPASISTISIGSIEAGGTPQLFGTIRNVRIWRVQLSANQLQAVTA